jgi:hypothetical protein
VKKNGNIFACVLAVTPLSFLAHHLRLVTQTHVAAFGRKRLQQAIRNMACLEREFTAFGRQCSIAAETKTSQDMKIMGDAVFRFATGGCRLKISFLIWGGPQGEAQLKEKIMMATMNR